MDHRPGLRVADRPQEGVLRVLNSRAEVRAFYDKISRVYDLLAERSEAPVRQTAMDLLSADRDEIILEIGFGTGHCLVELARAVGVGGRVIGLDISEGMLTQARALLARAAQPMAVGLVQGDAACLPLAARGVDAILMTFTLELFDTPEIPAVLAECRRVLRPGGRLVVASLSREGPRGLAMQAYEWTHRHFPNLLDCRPIYVARGLEDAGFQVQISEMRQMWVPVEVVAATRPAESR